MILYTTHCPKCNVLETKLNQKNISYKQIDDLKILQEKNLTSLPVLELEDEKQLNFVEANKYINSL